MPPQPTAAPPSPAGDALLLCLSPAPSNARVILAAARMAASFRGGFTALFVEPPDLDSLREEERRALLENLHLAEAQGACIATMYGDDPAVQIAEYARLSGITKIVLGRSAQRRGLFAPGPDLLDRLGALAPDLDIYIIPDEPGHTVPRRPRRRPALQKLSPTAGFRIVGILALCTLIGYCFAALGLTTANIIMVYILGVLCISIVTEGRGYSLVSSVLSVLIFNFCFTQPYFTLISSPRDIATFGVMFLVALIGSSLTVRIKQQAAQSAQKATLTEVLLETSRLLQKAEGAPAIYDAAAAQLKKLLRRDLLLYPVGEDAALQPPLLYPLTPGAPLDACLTAPERQAAQWVLQNNKHAGATTRTQPDLQCLYMAVRGSGGVLAVAGVHIGPTAPDAFEKNLMVAILNECGLALEKEAMVSAKQRVEETARQEALRANLLRAISHDLRTPLTSISGNAALLREGGPALDEPKRQALYTAIYDDAVWLINLVENLLSITRIENGAMRLNLQPELVEDVFHEALQHLDCTAAQHQITTRLPEELLMATMDARLIVQVLINLLNNAIKYTPAGSHITLSAQHAGPMLELCVCDDGPGLPPGSTPRLFEMFYTAGSSGDNRRGLGLGLALCRAIVTAHGGTITAENVAPHGARFCFTLPALEVAPHE